MRYLTFILALINLFIGIIEAQQTPLNSQYILNEFVLNPAVAGYNGITSINFSGRKQWWGLEGAPETFIVSATGRMLKATSPFISKKSPGPNSIKRGPVGRVGIGGSIIVDRNGAVNKTSANFTYSYHIPLYMSQLSIGFTLQGNQFKIDQEKAPLEDDPLIGLVGEAAYSPDASFGIDYSARKYHLGFAAHNLLQTPVKFGKTTASFRELRQVRQYYFLGTYRDFFKSDPKWEYETSVFARVTEKFNTTVDATLRIIFQEQYWFGVSYRQAGDLIAILGLRYDRFYFGYSYDYGFSALSKLTNGTHEINLAVKLGDADHRFRFWDRY